MRAAQAVFTALPTYSYCRPHAKTKSTLRTIKPILTAVALALSATLLVLTAPAFLRAQVVGPGNQTGFPVYGSHTGSDFDSVAMQNGNLHIDIPLVSLPGRQGTFRWDFVYDTPIWKATFVSINSGANYGNVAQIVDPATDWHIVTPDWWMISYDTVPVGCGPEYDQSGNFVGYATNDSLLKNFMLIAPDGTKHPLGLRWELSGAPNGGCYTNIPKSYALDGTGIFVDISGWSPNNPGINSSTIAILKDGTRILNIGAPALTSSRDRNGNLMTNNSDSLGRSPISMSFGPTTTYTTPLGKSVTGYSYGLVTATDSNGNTRTSRFDYQAIDIQTDGCQNSINSGPCQEVVTQEVVPKKLTLPDGLAYQFTYNNNGYGEILRIDLPTGGSVSYTYSHLTCCEQVIDFPSQNCSIQTGCPGGNNPQPGQLTVFSLNVVVTSRKLTNSDGTSSTWTYNIFPGSGGSVIDPLGNKEAHSFGSVTLNPSSVFSSAAPYEFSVQTYDPSGNLLRTVKKDYTGDYGAAGTGGPNDESVVNVRLIRETTTLENGLATKKETDFETVPQAGHVLPDGEQTATFLNPKEVREYDYGQGSPGSLLRRTDYAYLHSSNSAYLNMNILDRPTNVTVYTASGSIASETVNEYDNYSHAGQPMVASNAVQHDSGFGPTFSTRGNITAVQRWLSTTNSFLTTTNQYDDAGNLLSTIDPKGNKTTFDYTDSWTNATCAPSGQGKAYPTKITNALNQITTRKYNSCTGSLASTTDPNIQTTSYAYDLMNRASLISYPDGGQTCISFSDAPNATCPGNSLPALPLTVITTQKLTSSTSKVSSIVFDGLGRASQTQLNSDPDCLGGDKTDTTYDGLGRVHTVSNPYCVAGESTSGLTTYTYDALGRTCLVVPPDGTLPTGNVCPATQPANTIFTTYSGNTATVTDQAGKSRKSVADGLGRLIQVLEDPGSSPHLNYETDYTYDALDNLLSVNQKGATTDSTQWRTRTFTYDSLSRLTSSTNPESNTQPVSPFTLVPTTYSYDVDGNLLSKISPAPNQTGTATVTISYCYDALNRMTSKAYTAQSCPMSSPVATYIYDGGAAPSGCTLPALTVHNGIGRRTGMCDPAGSEAWSYDITANVGWMTTDARITNGVPKSTVVQDNLIGSPATLTYPSTRVITYTPDSANRISKVIDVPNSINYVTGTCANGTDNLGVCYTPPGSPSSFLNGASLASTFYYNSRLQPCRISVKSSGTAPSSCTDAINIGNTVDFTYNFSVGTSDNGNVTGITNNRDTTRSQSFTYDALNRIATAKTTSSSGTNCWDEQFGYDPWGNLLSIGRITGYSCSNEELLNASATPQNRVSGDTYDTAGNLTAIPSVAAYTYDAENHLTATAGVTYIYDGDGKRVQKSSGKLYWYGIGSDPLDETDLTGSITNSSFKEYVFFAGNRVASRDYQNNVSYYFSDHLGTARIVAGSSGSVLDDSDFYPFGGERVVVSSSGNRYKFTGKERDSESGLDNFGARYNSSSFGRFTSPDPLGGRLVNPQTLNKYSYVANNPLNYVDPTGLYKCKDSDKCDSDQDRAFEKARQRDLKSKDPNVVRDAKAYGDKNTDNGVSVQFGDPGKGKNGNTVSDVRVDPNDPSKVQASETVTIRSGLSGTDLAETVGHEGGHVADAQDFVNTIDIKSGGADQLKNLTEYATELKSYLVSDSILSSANEKRNFGDCGLDPCTLGAGVSPARVLENINRLLADPKNGYGVTPAHPGPVLYPLLTTPK